MSSSHAHHDHRDHEGHEHHGRAHAHDDHGHGHAHAPANFDRAFAIGIALNAAFVAIEAFYGWKVNSLALLADAGHNLSDVAGLVLAWAGAAAGAAVGFKIIKVNAAPPAVIGQTAPQEVAQKLNGQLVQKDINRVNQSVASVLRPFALIN